MPITKSKPAIRYDSDNFWVEWETQTNTVVIALDDVEQHELKELIELLQAVQKDIEAAQEDISG